MRENNKMPDFCIFQHCSTATVSSNATGSTFHLRELDCSESRDENVQILPVLNREPTKEPLKAAHIQLLLTSLFLRQQKHGSHTLIDTTHKGYTQSRHYTETNILLLASAAWLTRLSAERDYSLTKSSIQSHTISNVLQNEIMNL